MSQCLLLDPPAGIINGAGGKLDDVESIERAGGVFQLVIDRVLVPLERVQRRDSHPVMEDGVPRVEPVLVNRSRATRHEIQQAGCRVPPVGETDHAGQLFRPTPARTCIVSHMLINAQGFDTVETSRVRGGFRAFEHCRLRMLLITGGLDASPHTQP